MSHIPVTFFLKNMHKNIEKKAKKIYNLTDDATKGGFERMVAGEIHVDVECNPLEGPLVSELIQKMEKGETVEKIQYVEEGVFPAETVSEIIGSRAY